MRNFHSAFSASRGDKKVSTNELDPEAFVMLVLVMAIVVIVVVIVCRRIKVKKKEIGFVFVLFRAFHRIFVTVVHAYVNPSNDVTR